MKSAVVSKGPQKQSSSRSAPPGFQEQSKGQGGRTSKKTSGPTDPEKVELRDKPYNWIAARIHQLDLKGPSDTPSDTSTEVAKPLHLRLSR